MIIQIPTVGSVLDETYSYDSISNRIEFVQNHKRYKLEYYKNTSGGNSSLVKNDGIYEYKYDNNGNRISKEGNGEAWKYEWDLHNRLIKVEMESNGNKMVEVSYRYDHETNKLRRESDGNTVEYMYDFEGKLLYESEGTRKRSYVYMGSRLIGFTEGTKQYHIVTDETGSVRKIYEGDSEVWCGTYSPFGKLMSYEGELEITALYAGKEIDVDTGLTYHWNRWRNEEGDAFISEDPAKDGYNWYAYANANPFKYADSNGLESYVCRDGTFCSEGDISNPSYRADCYHYNGYNAGTIASMSGYRYNLWSNGGQGDKNIVQVTNIIKVTSQYNLENTNGGKIVGIIEPVPNQDEITEIIMAEVLEKPSSNIPDFMTVSVPLNQLDFDVMFGFSDGEISHSKSCKTVSMINSYASTYGVRKETILQVVPQWINKGWIDKDGSPLDTNKMSNSLAKSMGLKSHYEIPGYAQGGKWNSVSIETKNMLLYNVQFGIIMQYSKYFQKTHYVQWSSKYGVVDSLNPLRDGADTYEPQSINPLKEYKNY